MAAVLEHLPAELAAHLVPARRLESRRGVVATALPRLDELLQGGWPRGALSEVLGARSSGRTATLYASLASVLGAGGAAAMVDAEQALDVRMAARAGVPIERLLWVHAAGRQALRAAELLVDAGGFDLVVLDLGETRPRLPDAVWVRLRHAAERQRTAVLVAAAVSVLRAFGSVALSLERQAVDFGARSGARRQVIAWAEAPALFTALRSGATVGRGRSGDSDARFSLAFSVVEGPSSSCDSPEEARAPERASSRRPAQRQRKR